MQGRAFALYSKAREGAVGVTADDAIRRAQAAALNRAGRGGLGEAPTEGAATAAAAAAAGEEDDGGHHLLLGAGRRDDAVAKTGAPAGWPAAAAAAAAARALRLSILQLLILVCPLSGCLPQCRDCS